MDEEVKQKLLDYLTRLEEATDKGADFLGEQVPLFVQEYLSWYWWSAFLGVVLGFLLVILGVVLFFVARRMEDQEQELESDICVVRGFYMVGILVSWIFGVMVAADNLHSLIKVTVAPRVVVVEELSKLLNQ